MRRLHRAETAERARIVRAVTVALEAEPDVVFAYLHGSGQPSTRCRAIRMCSQPPFLSMDVIRADNCYHGDDCFTLGHPP